MSTAKAEALMACRWGKYGAKTVLRFIVQVLTLSDYGHEWL